MSDDDVTLSVSMPLDSTGFLRRECPTCEREFKWHASDDGEESVTPDAAGYYCPYCAIQAPTDQWLTQAQAQLVENIIERQVLGPMLQDLGSSLSDLERRTGGLVKGSLDAEVPDEMDPLTEQDDMARVDFACHPSEPVKVLDDWSKPVHCLVCGATS